LSRTTKKHEDKTEPHEATLWSNESSMLLPLKGRAKVNSTLRVGVETPCEFCGKAKIH
jgi:hypothetical protein